jgi:hypothetical protein
MTNILHLLYIDSSDDLWDSKKETIRNVMQHNNITNFELHDINESIDKGYVLIIKHVKQLGDYIKEHNKLPSLDNIIDKLIDCKIVYLNDTEPDSIDVLDEINRIISNYPINPNQIYIVNNNSKLIDLKSQLGSEINIHTNRRLAIWISQSMTHNHPKFTPNKLKMFTFHTREIKVHRFILLCLFKKYDILEDTDWSMLRGWDLKKRFLDEDGKMKLFYYDKVFQYEDLKYLEEEIRYLSNYDVKKSEFEGDFEFDIPNPNYTDLFKLNSYSKSYINIITESHFNRDIIHITEKSFLPFFFMQLPIFCASYGHIKKLRETYQYDMFDDLIDHSYDNEPNASKRFFMVFYEILRLSQMKDDIKKYYVLNRNRFLSNKEITERIKNDKTDYNFYLSLI